MLLLALAGSSLSPDLEAEVQVHSTLSPDYVPIKWGLIVLGNFDYYRCPPTANAIQKTEHWIQSEGVPYDIIEDDHIMAPSDTSAFGEYPLQYSDGTVRYGVFVIIMNYFTDFSSTNVQYVCSAVGNGTNAVIFGEAAKYVSELLNVTAQSVSYFTDYSLKTIDFDVLKSFNDGIEEYSPGNYNITFPNYYWRHANITDTTGKTVWYTCKGNTGEHWIGMANTTYGLGSVFWNSVIPSDHSFLQYATFETYWDAFKIVAHAINFIFTQIKKIDLGLQGYKEWRGAITYRLDQDGVVGLEKPDEEALKAGWYVDIVTPPLGYATIGGNLSDGIPNGYTGVPGIGAKWGRFDRLTKQTEPYLQYSSKNFTVYRSIPSGFYDKMRVDWNENQNFMDDNEYGIWQNQTDPSVIGTYYWSYIDNATAPNVARLGWWCSLRDRISDFSWWKEMGQQGYISYGFHGFQHQFNGNATLVSTYVNWDGSRFVMNQSWIEEKLTQARNELAYCLGNTGYGFEADGVLVSSAGNEYKPEIEAAFSNLTWIDLSYGDNSKNEPGWFLYHDRKPAMTCGGAQGGPYTPSSFEAVRDAVKTLFPIFGVYEHGAGYYNLTYDVNPSDTAYGDMFCFAHLDDSFEFYSNARYMWINTITACYENGKIVLDYKANSTLHDYVWRFPIVCNGKCFNGFSDSRHIANIKNIDGKYVYVQFNEGADERIEATYGTNPHINGICNYISNLTQMYTSKNLTLRLWNVSGTVGVKVNCTKLQQPAKVEVNGTHTDFTYDSVTDTCLFNVTLNDVVTVEILWDKAPPDSPTLVSPGQASRHNPNASTLFTWRFNDPDVGDYQYAYRFQFSNDYNFAALIVDTGKILSSSGQIAQTLPIAVHRYFWRVTTWDQNDTLGDWSPPQQIIVDRLKVTEYGASKNRTNVGESVQVYFNVTREYDSVLFDETKGAVYVNGSAAVWDGVDKYWKLSVELESVGKESYEVSEILDQEFNITALDEPQRAQQVIWDRVLVTLTPDSTNVTQGVNVNFAVTARYAYDNRPISQFEANILRDGIHFASNNFTDLCNDVITHQYTTENVTETVYGLSVFTSNSLTVNWVQSILGLTSLNALIVIAILGTCISISIMFIRKRKNSKKMLAKGGRYGKKIE